MCHISFLINKLSSSLRGRLVLHFPPLSAVDRDTGCEHRKHLFGIGDVPQSRLVFVEPPVADRYAVVAYDTAIVHVPVYVHLTLSSSRY